MGSEKAVEFTFNNMPNARANDFLDNVVLDHQFGLVRPKMCGFFYVHDRSPYRYLFNDHGPNSFALCRRFDGRCIYSFGAY